MLRSDLNSSADLVNFVVKVALLTPLVQQAQDLVTIIQRTTTTPAAGSEANNVIVIADYFLSSGTEKCGPQTITGQTWSVEQ